MEERKLTKADIDKVRHIEGFPIAKDEDIIALSRPPYYTACPNPFIEEFIQEKGTPYDEASDDYHREPYSGDVSEGKSDPIYMAHSYHTKVPYRAMVTLSDKRRAFSNDAPAQPQGDTRIPAPLPQLL